MNEGEAVRRVATAHIPTDGGVMTAYAYESADGSQHLAMVRGDVAGRDDVLVRLHSECLTGDVFGSLRCDCGSQLRTALALIAQEGRGVVLYLRGHEGRGIGLAHKISAYRLQEEGYDTVDANVALGLPVDSRQYGAAAPILADLGIVGVRLLTNNPKKVEGLGMKVVQRVPLEVPPGPENVAYLRTKRERLGHLLGGLDGVGEAR